MNYKLNVRMGFINYVIGFIIMLCLIFSQFRISTYIALVVFVVYMIMLLWNNTEIYIKYLHSVFGCVAVLISMGLIEIGGYYVSERQMMGRFIGSTPLLVFSYWVFFEMLKFFDYKHEKRTFHVNQESISIGSFFSRENVQTRNILRYITIASVLLLGYMFACVIKNPSFMMGLDRGQYSQMFKYSVLYSKVLSWAQILLIPCVLSFIYGNRKIGLLGIVCYVLHSFWVGQKFGSFMSLLNLFFIIFYPKIREQKIKVRKIALTGLSVILILILFSAFAFSFTSEMGLEKYFATRMAGQGAMWWGTYSVSDGTPHIGQLTNEVEGFLFYGIDTHENVGAKYGIYNIMYLCCPKGKVDYDIQYLNTRYTEAGFASAYYIFGTVGPIIFAVVCAFLFSLTVNFFLRCLNRKKLFEAALVLRLYSLLTVMMCMFTFNQFRSVIVIFSVIWLFTTKSIRIKLKGINEKFVMK